MTQSNAPRGVKAIVELIDHSSTIAGLNERDDLVERLARARDRITDPQIRVVVAGQLKQGKSQLVNSLLNMAVARVGDDETTTLPTVVGYGDQPAARLVVADADDRDPAVIEVSVSEIGADLRFAPQAGGRRVIRLEVDVPSPLLTDGLAFVDTPGVGGYGQPHLSATLGLLPDAAAMLMVSDTSQEFTEPEMAFLRQAVGVCPVAAVVLTKTDLYPHWRQIADADTGHLQRCGVALPVIPTSSLLRSHAVAMNDPEINEESNFPAIMKFLSDQVMSGQHDRIRDQVLAEIRSAAEHLSLGVGSELEALKDPEVAARLTRELQDRKREAEDALQHTALWQQVLGDGIADLSGDVDHDLRARFREITQHTEQVIDSCDPTVQWTTIGAELEESVADAVGDNFVWAYHRAEELAEEVARTFVEAGLDAVDVPELRVAGLGSEFGQFRSLATLESKTISKSSKAVSGLRGSYGGVLMFGMLSTVVGIGGMFNPLSIGAGALLGRKAYKEEMENRMLRIRGEAKMNVRKFIDDVSFVVSKESRDRLKTIQRHLRDHYRGIANQTTRSLNESLQAAATAARLEESERNVRIKELERQLNILRQIIQHATDAAPAGRPAQRPGVPTPTAAQVLTR